ncbi:DNA (cytosine-5)-methyltransferase CMT2-like isoform X2 [Rhododendron vialii]|uniref:DNA (cytosine-5)-methyltransferase CMT2-like isoform X2 n=1 Tax=Rhododendron vialii TaxID=182163 RepID=UPI00265DD93A|nr:DNA (cytosine-5)-methyltransferase CMT2-like isoform X2 [Rhododendron vialii]
MPLHTPQKTPSSSKSTMPNTPQPNSLRRSPRLTPPPPAAAATKSPAKKRPPSSSKNALALTLHASANNLDPAFVAESCSPTPGLRRSPRLTSTPLIVESLLVLHSSALDAPAMDSGPALSADKCSSSPATKKYRGVYELKSLGALPAINSGSALYAGKCLLRPASKKYRGVHELKSLGALPAIDSGPALSAENCSSRPASKKYRGVFELKSLGALSPVEKRESVGSGLERGGSDGKRLRSREVRFRFGERESDDGESGLVELLGDSMEKRKPKKIKTRPSSEKEIPKTKSTTCFFVGEPVAEEEARERWSWRYELKSKNTKCQSWKLNEGEEDEIILNVDCHYSQAQVTSCIFNLGDCAYIKGDGSQKHVGKILEFFKTTDGDDYFRVQWFFRAEDTVMKEEAAFHDQKRLFYSTLMNDNLLECIISKLSVVQIPPTLGFQPNSIQPSDFYYDMEYCVEYSTFRTLLTDDSAESSNLTTPDDFEAFCAMITATPLEEMANCQPYKADLALLDLYAGCGGMSTGFCLGAKLSSVNLVTRWAVDANKSACESLRLNHPETQVRNETAEDFLELVKGWEKLCQWYVLSNLDPTHESRAEDTTEVKINEYSPSDVKSRPGEYEVLRLVDICYGDTGKRGKRGLKFKVRWKGYSSDDDTWEPIEGLSNCQERIQDFVRSGFKSKILPLPGDVDVLCGGPPCQGISGYNRFRNIDSPLDDERNHQIVVFMDIVKFLMPKYVLMENVVDILRFDKASLARYALSRLVDMRYQARLGTIAAGCYGLPQFRLRVFLWGALPCEKLPQFPRPTHDVVVRYWPPSEFEQNTVAYDEGEHRELEEAAVLRDAISDLPAVTWHEKREQMAYEKPPETEFQRYIRLTKDEMMGFSKGIEDAKKPVLYDHRPYQLNEDDYLRVCQIPHKKGANFRDLPGVVVGPDNVVLRDPKKEQMMLPSGKPMVPDYVFTFEQGKSRRPFARLWWDETVPTVVTFPSLHNSAALHPEQDRPLTIREYARLQGFPDFYRFCGTTKGRYRQVGNAVAVPVARALGYAMGMASQKLGGNEPLMTLPSKFALQRFPTEEILSMRPQ